MSIKTTDKDNRKIVEEHDTARPEIKLRITTRHDKHERAIRVRVSRVHRVQEGYCRERFSLADSDPCPVEPVSVPVARYSLAMLETVHANFIRNRVAGAGQIAALKEWAERY